MEDGKNSIENEEVYIFILGMEKVGKTSFISRYSGKTFSEEYKPTISMISTRIEIVKEEKQYPLVIYDNPSNHECDSNKFFKSEGIIFMYDATDKEVLITFQRFCFSKKMGNKI